MKAEIWKDIYGYEGQYQVSNLGRVKSLARVITRGHGIAQPVKERILKPAPSSSGYMCVGLNKSGVRKTHRVHKLVAIAFLNHELNGMKVVVNHRNNLETDNRVENLELVTQRHNTSVDKWRHNTTSKYVGVYLYGCYKDGSPRWKAAIYINGKHKYIGVFRDEEQAAEAYQTVLKEANK